MAVDFHKLRDADMFKHLSDEVLQALAQHCHVMELQAGATLFEQNSPGDAMYLLETGQVHIVRQEADGEQVILATEGPYYMIGDLSMLVGHPRTGSVVAVSDCTLIVLSKVGFDSVCAQTSELAVKVLAHVAQRLYRTTLQLREHAIGNVPARVATLLVLLSGGKNGPVNAHIRVSRMARATATNADTVERLLNDWTRQGIIEYDARRITVNDIEALRDIAG
jgi:CRP/FNR family cyclic AMP-dependent transcriptional regulator